MFLESSHFFIFALCISPRDQMLDIRNNLGPHKFKSTCFVLVSFHEYEDFVLFVTFWSQPPVSLNNFQATKFHETGVNSS